ncbi:exosome complex component Rrp40 isoform X2 [Dermacentor variabilis]|uniref:exosome complex component Rrp40 isoform X2 n=1 Tax=Dermacentor variabilis TaxID=34621 RepID=UPI003F5C78F4
MPRCCAFGRSTLEKDDKRLFRIPSERRDAARRKVWLQRISRADFNPQQWSRLRGYIPAKGDCVIGVVTAKGGETVRVNIGCSEPATLSVFAFEGATKRNRPDVEVGDIVMAQVLMANRGMEPELVCVDSYGKKGILGVLRSPTGFLIKVPINLINKLLAKDCSLLQTLGKRSQFEIALGHNGRIWVNGTSLQCTLHICNAILSAENLSAQEIEERCLRLGT